MSNQGSERLKPTGKAEQKISSTSRQNNPYVRVEQLTPVQKLVNQTEIQW